jgi:hypothetical protein
VDNIEMDLVEIEWSGVAHDTYKWKALVNAVMNFWGS